MALKAPHDRVNGYVELSGYVPEFPREHHVTGTVEGDALRYCQAFMTLARRYDDPEMHGPKGA